MTVDTEPYRLRSVLCPEFTFARFEADETNQDALVAACRVADTEASAANPLLLMGPQGAGRTHLMHAIGWHIQERSPGTRILAFAGADFEWCFRRAARDGHKDLFRGQFRPTDVLLIDDIHYLLGRGRQRVLAELQRIGTELLARGKRIVATTDHPMSMTWGASGRTVTVAAGSRCLRRRVLARAVTAAGMAVPGIAVSFLADAAQESTREALAYLRVAAATACLERRPLTMGLARQVVRALGQGRTP